MNIRSAMSRCTGFQAEDFSNNKCRYEHKYKREMPKQESVELLLLEKALVVKKKYQQYVLVLLRKTKGYIQAEVPKSRQFWVKYWYISKRKSSANRDGPAEQDQGGKHRDTYFLKRRYTRDFGSVFGFRCQKKLVNGNGLHEQDQHKNKRIRTS